MQDTASVSSSTSLSGGRKSSLTQELSHSAIHSWQNPAHPSTSQSRLSTAEPGPVSRPSSWQSSSRYSIASSQSSSDRSKTKLPTVKTYRSLPPEHISSSDLSSSRSTRASSVREPGTGPMSPASTAYSPMAAGFARLNKQALEKTRQSPDPAAKFFM